MHGQETASPGVNCMSGVWCRGLVSPVKLKVNIPPSKPAVGGEGGALGPLDLSFPVHGSHSDGQR